ncbi:MAG: ATP-dependent nuclease, partial [Candidatus Binatia bacterium]
ARQWTAEHLPKFIYFDRYDAIESAIHIPSFIRQVATNQSGPRMRATQCLFKHAGLHMDKLAGLESPQPDRPEEDLRIRRQIDERAILVSLASNAMTRRFGDWWDQRKHKFRYQLDGDYFRIWVSDDLDPSDIELDQRSAGMQYFFSFFTIFLAESQGAHADNILLLDEPGLHLHGAAQAKVVQFLEKLSHDHQTLYSTHSPFMVDVHHLENARAVYEGDDGTTKVSEEVWPRDRDSLFALQAALGYQVAQGLFLTKRQVIIEGITDLWLLKALDLAIAARGRTQLRPDLTLVPAAGLAKLFPLASILLSHEVEVAVLLGGQEPARQAGQKLTEKLLAGKDRKCLFIGDFTNNPQAELEDLFPETDYLSALKKAYPGTDLTFSAQEKALPGIVQRVEALFKRKELGHFERWKPAMMMRDRLLEAPRMAPLSVVDVTSRIFEAVNALFPAAPAKGANGSK